jgi:hypothetical protein
MSAIPHTPQPGFATSFAFRRLALVLALVAALAVAALTVAIVSLATDNGGVTQASSATSAQALPSAQPYNARPNEGLGVAATSVQRIQGYTARPNEGLGTAATSKAPEPAPNDGSDHSGARP